MKKPTKTVVWLTLAMLLAAASSVIVAADSKPITSLGVVEVNTLVLVDENGDTQGVLAATKHGCILDLRRIGGRDKGFSISMHRGKSGAALIIDFDDKKIAEVFASEAGGGIQLRNAKGRILFQQGVREDGKGYQ